MKIMNIEGPGDPGTVWLSVTVAALFWRRNAEGQAAHGLSEWCFLPSTTPVTHRTDGNNPEHLSFASRKLWEGE